MKNKTTINRGYISIRLLMVDAIFYTLIVISVIELALLAIQHYVN